MNADDFVLLLGLTYDDDEVKQFLAACGITKKPKVRRDSFDAYLVNKDFGLDITFTDERDVDIRPREYDDGALVLTNIRMYGEGSTQGYKKFTGNLPHGLNFDLGFKAVRAKLGSKPTREDKESASARWDFGTYCLFIDFDKLYERVRSIDLQLPVE
jgi:hypothetical protein